MTFFIRSFIFIAILAAIDTYVWQAFKTLQAAKWVGWLYWVVTALVYIGILAAALTDARTWPTIFRTYLFSAIVILLVSKLIVVVFLLLDDISRFMQFLWHKINPTAAIPDSATEISGKSNTITRSKFLSLLGLGLGSIPLLTLMWGIIRNAHNYQIKRVLLPIANLPAALQGLTIAQISDIHSGSFVDAKPVQKGINLLNSLNPDLVFFTGDLVNMTANEIEPYLSIFGQIQSKYGVFSITGNHDYADYMPFTREERAQNFEQLKKMQQRMGWQLLLNEHKIIQIEDENLAVIGVENWSNKARFSKYGDLAKAYSGCEDAAIKLLLSHDPSHWRAQVLPQFPDIQATFSGHTHGFQFGVDKPWLKWSPAKWMYSEWLGLYNEGKQYLYVNPGFGYLSYPSHIGILPEITLFELTTA